MRARAAVVHLVGEDMFLEIFGGGQHRTGFEQRHVQAAIRKDLDGRAAARSRSDHNHVENLGRSDDLQHP